LGANVGVYTYFAASRGAFVISVEPFTVNFSKLQRNIQRNKLKARAVNVAITSKNGFMSLNVAEGMGSHKVAEEGKIKVKTFTLKALLKGVEKVDIMKMDIEGSELDVLKSSKLTLRKVQKIVVETHNNEKEIISLLESYGYRLNLVDEGRIIYASRD